MRCTSNARESHVLTEYYTDMFYGLQQRKRNNDKTNMVREEDQTYSFREF